MTVTDKISVIVDVMAIGILLELVTVEGDTGTLQLGVIVITTVCLSVGLTSHDVEFSASIVVSSDGSPSSIMWFITNNIHIAIIVIYS